MAVAKQTARKVAKAAKKSGKSAGAVPRKRMYRPGTVALRQIKKLQAGTQLLCARASFQRVVREAAQSSKVGLRFQHSALLCLQDATESYLVGLLSDANLLCLHSKRVTVFPRDVALARRLRGERH